MKNLTLQHIYPERLICVYRVGAVDEVFDYNKIKHIINLPHKVFPTIESCLIHILSVKEYSDLPKIINLNYKDFLYKPVPLEEVLYSIRTCIALTTQRLNRGIETVRINFRIEEPFSAYFADYLDRIGVDNLVPHPSFYTNEQWQENIEQVIHGIRTWPDYLISGNKELTVCSIPKPINSIKLTNRQEQIVHLIKNRGYSNKQIAKHLSISESAVKMHVGALLKKIGCRNRTQLSRAVELGLKA